MTLLHGYKAELVLHDPDGNRLFVTDGLKAATARGELVVDLAKVKQAIDRAHLTQVWDSGRRVEAAAFRVEPAPGAEA